MNEFYWTRTFLKRVGRLIGTLATAPAALGSRRFPVWLHHCGCCLFDAVGGPELAQLLLRSLTETRSLTDHEIGVASAVLGVGVLPYERVRLAQGGILAYAFGFNNNRAFSTWHTINLPKRREEDLPLLVHELTHTLQFERVGTVYIGQALLEQKRHGREAYNYGGEEGLRSAVASGKRYRDYNREQQGQITQDYCARLHEGKDTSAYAPLIAQLRAGKI